MILPLTGGWRSGLGRVLWAATVLVWGGCTLDFDPGTLPLRPADAGMDAPPVPDGGLSDGGSCGEMFHACCTSDGGQARCNGDLVCTGGYCVPCSGGTTSCGGSCEDLRFDPHHCGSCTTACATRQNCASGRCQTPCPAGQTACGTACVFTATDPDDCGACGRVCGSANASATCVRGVCALGACDPGWGNCNGSEADGCETDVTSALANCGACGNACSFTNATGSCTAGACTLGACSAGFADCDGMVANGCETNTRTNAHHCGGCSTACATAQRCVAATCVTTTTVCTAGQADCAGSGTCNDLSSDAANCGACGNACALAHATAGCTSGGCTVASCAAGYADCDHDPANGCEANLQSDARSCGRCGHGCTLPHASATCTTGACVLGACDAGWGNCDGDPLNGCETDLTVTISNCGACGNTCAFANAAATCAMGVCQLGACAAGFADCDAVPGNGCEAALMADPGNCGMCHATCSAANATPACVAGTCRLGMCDPGYQDCNARASDGCEASVTSDPAHCGDCLTACSFTNGVAACVGGGCQLAGCVPGYADCDSVASTGCEVAISSDPANCGACRHSCAPGQVCATGRCGASCSGGQTPCAGACVDVRSSPTDCGTCGHACPTRANASAACVAGVCGLACNPGWGDCNMNPSDGCETSTTADVANCGACGSVCPPPANAAPTCAAGRCGFVCLPGFADCNGVAADGCEVALATDAMHCGSCSGRCAVAAGGHAVPTCARGACGFTCMAGWGDCDGNPANGCESPLSSSTLNCGACGNRCWYANATAACTTGTCQLAACAQGFGDCNSSADDGCETNLAGNPFDCGACGNACAPPAANNQRGTCTLTGTAWSCGTHCLDRFANCNGMAADGCEADLRQSPNCGRCGTTCGALQLCGATGCVVGLMCGPPVGSPCPATGECVRTSSDMANCGSCGNRCVTSGGATPDCSGGRCQIFCPTVVTGSTPQAALADCDGNLANGCETDTRTSASNCGGCGTACSTGQYCASGHCCPTDQTACGNNCVDLAYDVNNCGACGVRCRSLQSCVGGTCVSR